jgi:hypothetical protein
MIHRSDTASQNVLIGKEAPVSAVRFGGNAYHVIERATGKVKTRRKEGRESGGGRRIGVLRWEFCKSQCLVLKPV